MLINELSMIRSCFEEEKVEILKTHKEYEQTLEK